MKHRKLGNTGFNVSEIGMGTEHLLDKDEQIVIQTIKAAVDGGVTYLDCHPGHDLNHDSHTYEGYAKLGKAISIAGGRDRLQLTYLAAASFSPAEIKPRYENFLKDMNISCVDVFILACCDKVDNYDEITGDNSLLSYAKKLKDEGKIKTIGISTHSAAVAFKAIDSGSFDVLMYPVNPAFDVIIDEERYKTDELGTLWDAAYDFDSKGKTGAQPRKSVYDECEKRGIGLVAMKPFAGGFIFRVEENAGFTPVNLISYTLAQSGVSTVVPGCTKPEEIYEILTYNNCPAEDRDYSSAVAKSRWSVMENCLYCNHCLPCKANINIAEVNRLLDSSENASEKYNKLAVKASACTQCGICVERCPFQVKVIERMEKAVEIFEK